MEMTFCTTALRIHIHLSGNCHLLSVKNKIKKKQAEELNIITGARTFLEFPTRPIRKNRIRVTNCRNARGLWAPTTWPRFHWLGCAYRFGICAVSASFLISYIPAANVEWRWDGEGMVLRRRRRYSSYHYNKQRGGGSGIAYRVRIFGCPFAIVG